ncbi:putative fibrinogen C domain-containing protein 1-like [Apostichopus japonicus]|uniref:Putative fibrinogen C domain-containing protein 1-like n=1 Tax=Stichopus japonicus TaxID=307972 RepID=A0A2G8KVB9_STIJA|nr:putative fibrinogen C domain-containing protein 1-like [Apostichopus japonicus]
MSFNIYHSQEGESYINSDCSLRITCNSNVLTSESYSCSADATCEERKDVRRCYCNEWFEGDGLTCTRSGPTDCSDLYAANRTNNGAYTIYPAGSSGFEVYCEMSSGGWTILQRRTSSSVNFYRNWNEYKHGFGIPTGDHWIGNDKIYSLTKQTDINYQLLIEKTNTEGSTYHSRYSSFSISNEGDKYQLSLGDFDGNAGMYCVKCQSYADL